MAFWARADNGQASYVGLPGQEVASRHDHIFMSSAFFRLADVASETHQ